MNIYNFIKIEQNNNRVFIKKIKSTYDNLIFSSSFDKRILETIEFFVKRRIYYLIKYEYDIAIEANLSINEDDFINNLSNSKGWKEYFFDEYPPLKKYYNKEYTKIRDLIKYVISCFSNDFEMLNTSDKVLDNIDIGEGDFHNGLSTCKLLFTDGSELYFKPRSLTIDNKILTFCHNIEKELKLDMFYPVENIDCVNYGWSIPVRKKECGNIKEVGNYYYNMGFLTSLTYFLNIEDLIYDNVIACGSRVALIDLECSLCTPREINKKSQFVFDSHAGKIFLNSIIASGIIPRYTYKNRYNDGESDASLSYITERKIFNVNDNHIKENHIPKLKGKPYTVNDFIKEYMGGFKMGFSYFLNNKTQLFEFIENCKGLETRIIYRPTKIYSILLKELFSYNSLTKTGYKNKIIRSLKKGRYVGIEQKIIESEQKQLKEFDIPVFKKIIGEDAIYNAKGIKVDIMNKESDLSYIKNKITQANWNDFLIQKDIAVNSLKIFEDIKMKNKIIRFDRQTNKRFESSLESLIKYIKENLFLKKNEVSALNIFSNANNGLEYGVIGSSVSNGLGGIALLFGIYGHFYNDIDCTSICETILKRSYKKFTLQMQDIELFDSIGHILISPFQYPINLIYINEVLYQVLGYYVLPQKNLSEKTFLFLDKHIEKDEHFDFLLGSCGASFLFFQLYEKYQTSNYLKIFKKLSEHIYEAAIVKNQKAYWDSEKFHRLGGFLHGNSSLSVSMLLAYRLLRKPKFLNLFQKSYNYDQSLFNPELKGYQDVRYLPLKRASSAWAHGFGGIGLSRLIMNNYLDKNEFMNQIKICRNAINQTVINSLSTEKPIFSMNGGFAGNIEVLWALNNQLKINNDYVEKAFKEYLRKISTNSDSLIGQKNHIHLFMNEGVTGLAYSILRFLHTKEVPSVLIMGINNTFGTKHLYKKKELIEM